MERTDHSHLYADPQTLEHPRIRPVARRTEPELAPKRLFIHGVLFLLTAITTTLTGAAWTIPVTDPHLSFLGSILAPHAILIRQVAGGNYGALLNGLTFTFTVLLILGAHEFGHYFACRHYRVRATLPFFIPGPPWPLTPFGTFGAVIKIKEPIRSRRALFDIGIAGPLAGFAFALPASVIGLLMARPHFGAMPPGEIEFLDPLLFKIIMRLFHVPEMIEWNPVYWASWCALLVTSLNLFPVGQLDGGHVMYAVAGPRLHKWVSRVTCVALGILAFVSFFFYSSPVWFLWTLVLLFLLIVGHPPVFEEEPLGRTRTVLAIIAVLVFIVCFMPVPITLHL